MSKSLLNLLQISKALVYSKIKSLFGNEFSFTFGPISLAASRPSRGPLPLSHTSTHRPAGPVAFGWPTWPFPPLLHWREGPLGHLLPRADRRAPPSFTPRPCLTRPPPHSRAMLRSWPFAPSSLTPPLLAMDRVHRLFNTKIIWLIQGNFNFTNSPLSFIHNQPAVPDFTVRPLEFEK
jgi:hypothetical protein